MELPEVPDDHAERLGERVIARVDNAALLGQIASLEKRAERAAREKVDRVSKGRVDREVELQANLQVRPTLFLSPTSCVLSACVSSSF